MSTASSTLLNPLWEELLGSPEFAAHCAVSRGLPPRREAVKAARDFTRTTLRHWGLPEISDDMVLVASELVTNALRHAVVPVSRWWYTGSAVADWGRPIRICLARRGPRVVCAVQDPSNAEPVIREPDQAAEAGRGLRLVGCFSAAWGWQALPSGVGKIVWALFLQPTGGPRVPASPLSRVPRLDARSSCG